MAENSGDTPTDDLHDPAEPFDAGQWAMHGLLSTHYDLEVGRACPPVSDLWLSATASKPLGSNKAHVQDCPRCQKQLLLIRRELKAGSVATTGGTVRPMWPYIAGGLAVAACLMLLLIALPERTSSGDRFASQIASASEAIDARSESELRGGQADQGLPNAVHEEWLEALLSDPPAVQALKERSLCEHILKTNHSAGRLQIENDRMVLPTRIDKQSATARRLIELLEQDDVACERVVSALIRHFPGASENDRADLRKALDRWRAKEVFGVRD